MSVAPSSVAIPASLTQRRALPPVSRSARPSGRGGVRFSSFPHAWIICLGQTRARARVPEGVVSRAAKLACTFFLAAALAPCGVSTADSKETPAMKTPAPPASDRPTYSGPPLADDPLLTRAESTGFKATIEQLSDVQRPTQDHLYWPQLDVDL